LRLHPAAARSPAIEKSAARASFMAAP
jgi:hypothetical protein